MLEITLKIGENEAKVALHALLGEDNTLYEDRNVGETGSWNDIRWIDTMRPYFKLLDSLGYIIPIDEMIEVMADRLDDIREERINNEVLEELEQE